MVTPLLILRLNLMYGLYHAPHVSINGQKHHLRSRSCIAKNAPRVLVKKESSPYCSHCCRSGAARRPIRGLASLLHGVGACRVKGWGGKMAFPPSRQFRAERPPAGSHAIGRAAGTAARSGPERSANRSLIDGRTSGGPSLVAGNYRGAMVREVVPVRLVCHCRENTSRTTSGVPGLARWRQSHRGRATPDGNQNRSRSPRCRARSTDAPPSSGRKLGSTSVARIRPDRSVAAAALGRCGLPGVSARSWRKTRCRPALPGIFRRKAHALHPRPHA